MIYQAASSHFRKHRNVELSQALRRLATSGRGQPVQVLDVGGSEAFWTGLDLTDVALTILNHEASFGQAKWFPAGSGVAARKVAGTALDLREHHDRFDVVVCNSVIEHVGSWPEIDRCASELLRVAPNGWVQTPAYGFPIEPHYALPFVHWLSPEMKVRALRALPHHGAPRRRDLDYARRRAASINLLTERQFANLFAPAQIRRERVLGLTKSLIATWGALSPPRGGRV